jgi:hypothetical protein
MRRSDWNNGEYYAGLKLSSMVQRHCKRTTSAFYEISTYSPLRTYSFAKSSFDKSTVGISFNLAYYIMRAYNHFKAPSLHIRRYKHRHGGNGVASQSADTNTAHTYGSVARYGICKYVDALSLLVAASVSVKQAISSVVRNFSFQFACLVYVAQLGDGSSRRPLFTVREFYRNNDFRETQALKLNVMARSASVALTSVCFSNHVNNWLIPVKLRKRLIKLFISIFASHRNER